MSAAASTFPRFFAMLDRDDNGEIEARDFEHLLDALRRTSPRPDRLEAAVGAATELWELLSACLDADDSGTVSREEFMGFEQMLAQQTEEFGDEPPWLRDFFRTILRALDTTESGGLDVEGYRTFVGVLGLDADVEASFRQLTGGAATFALDELDARLTELFRSSDDTARGHALLPSRLR